MKKIKIKNKALIASSALLIALTTIGGVAYAKYVTKITGQGKGEIAKWSFLSNGEDEDFGTFFINRETYDISKIANGKIAPGTSGTFDINIDASGTDTGVDYKVSMPQYYNKPTNLYFKYNDKVYKTFFELGKALSGSIEANNPTKIITKTVQWVWDYETTDNGKTVEENDEIDTIDGRNAYNFVFDVEIIGTQSKTA